MSDNLLKIGSSAVYASSKLLSTTSNNIANVNTEGYVRQRTEFVPQSMGLGVGKGTTERLVSDFTLKQLWRDTSRYSYASQYMTEANRIDALFSDSANSIATGINDLFTQIQTANNEPSNLSTRQLIIGSAEALLDKFNALSSVVLDQDKYVNQQLEIYTGSANSYIQEIASLNKQIAAYGPGNTKDLPLDLMDRRDQAILNLSELMEISVLDASNGEKQVFMATGQALVLEQGNFNLISLKGDPDPNRMELQLQLSAKPVVIRDVSIDDIGGSIGGLLAFRKEILDPIQNQLGQLALSMTDALNSQNALGMNLNGEIGGDIFTLPTFNGLSYSSNTGSGFVTMQVESGHASQLPPNDFLLTVEATGVRIQALDVDGKVISGSDKFVTVSSYPATINSSDAAGDLYGLEITLSGTPAVGDKFELKPLSTAARTITLATTRPEDIALASPIRTEININNMGNAAIDNLQVTDTTASTLPAYGFTTTAGIVNGPWTMTYLGNNNFEITDNLGNTVAAANFASADYQNVFAQAGVDVGFDFSVTGIPNIGDSFTIAYNEGGYNDNRNGLALAGLQSATTTRLNALSVTNGVNSVNFNQSYSSMVTLIGEKTSQARNSEAASLALLEQTTAWYESLSGVSLDEEASNLIRFQQTYAAASRILSTSQTIFDTLFEATR